MAQMFKKLNSIMQKIHVDVLLYVNPIIIELINKVKERRLKLVKEKIRSENLWEGRTSKFIKSNTTIKASKTDNIQHKPSFIRVYKKTKVDQLPSINKNHRKELPELKIKGAYIYIYIYIDGFEESSLEYNRIRSVSPMLLGIGKGKFAVMDSSIRKEDLKIKTRSSISTKRSQSVSLRTNIHTLNNQNNTTGQKYIQKIITNVKTGHKKFALQQKVYLIYILYIPIYTYMYIYIYLGKIWWI